MMPHAVPRRTCALTLGMVLGLIGCGGGSGPVDGSLGTTSPRDPDAPAAVPADGAVHDSPVDAPPDGSGGADADPPDGPPPPSPLVLSEVMYHPVLEDDYEEQHEFVELHNRGDVAGGPGRLAAGRRHRLHLPRRHPAAGRRLPGGGEEPRRAAGGDQLRPGTARRCWATTPASWTTPAGTVPCSNAARRRGGRGPATATGFPWPMAADAPGGGRGLAAPGAAAAGRPTATGASRWNGSSFDLPADQVANWVPSPLDGATPGPGQHRHRHAAGHRPGAVGRRRGSGQPGPSGHPQRRSGGAAGLSLLGRRRSAGVAAASTSSTTWNAPTRPTTGRRRSPAPGRNGRGAPARPGRQQHRSLPHRGGPGRAGLEVLSPAAQRSLRLARLLRQPADHQRSQPPYQLFIKSTDWGRLWTNVEPPAHHERRVSRRAISGTTVRCQIRDSWDARVPAVLVHRGRGLRRAGPLPGQPLEPAGRPGIDLGRTTINPLPSPMMPDPGRAPARLRALSWNISFPRYRRFEGQPGAASS